MNEQTQWTGTGNTLATTLSVILFFISRFTLSDLAAMFAIIAAGSTAALNWYKFYQLRKKQKQDDEAND